MITFVTTAFVISVLLCVIVVLDELADRRLGRRIHREMRYTFHPRMIGARRRALARR